ncbi:hypothetical protein HD554DRAFT_1776393 [Boletus coccyginus]|nr:hypothetical protein HD554DRAFT_1776393 [Boletus coccyginus]
MSQSDPCSVVRIAIALAALKHKPRDQSTACKFLRIADPTQIRPLPNSLPARSPLPLSSREQGQCRSRLADVRARARRTTRDSQSSTRCGSGIALQTPHRRISGSLRLGCAASQEEEQKEPHQGPTRSRVALGPKSCRLVPRPVVPVPFVAIARRSVYLSQRCPRLSQCRRTLVRIPPCRRDPPRARHGAPLLVLPSEPASIRNRARPALAAQARAYRQHAHRAGVSAPHVRPPDGLARPGLHSPRQHQEKTTASAPHPRLHRRTRVRRQGPRPPARARPPCPLTCPRPTVFRAPRTPCPGATQEGPEHDRSDSQKRQGQGQGQAHGLRLDQSSKKDRRAHRRVRPHRRVARGVERSPAFGPSHPPRLEPGPGRARQYRGLY